MIRLAFLSALQLVIFIGLSILMGPNVELIAFFIACAVNLIIILSNPRAQKITLPVLSPILSFAAVSLALQLPMLRPEDLGPSMLFPVLLVAAIVWVGTPVLIAYVKERRNAV